MTALFEHYAIRQLSMQALRKIAGPTATSALIRFSKRRERVFRATLFQNMAHMLAAHEKCAGQ